MEEATTFFTRFADGLGRKFEPEVRHHLAKVYICLFATSLCATLGAVLHIIGILEVGLTAAFLTFGLLLALHFIQDNGKNFPLRLSLLLAFGFCSGQTLGPILDYIIQVNPQIIVTALIGTCLVFISFTASALLAERGQFMFLGGLLISIINGMALMSIFNLFTQSYYIAQGQLYIGLGVMSAYILYDTQAIVEKVRMGSKDCIQHSLDLFFDLIGVFRRLLIILTQKEERERRNKRKN